MALAKNRKITAFCLTLLGMLFSPAWATTGNLVHEPSSVTIPFVDFASEEKIRGMVDKLINLNLFVDSESVQEEFMRKLEENKGEYKETVEKLAIKLTKNVTETFEKAKDFKDQQVAEITTKIVSGIEEYFTEEFLPHAKVSAIYIYNQGEKENGYPGWKLINSSIGGVNRATLIQVFEINMPISLGASLGLKGDITIVLKTKISLALTLTFNEEATFGPIPSNNPVSLVTVIPDVDVNPEIEIGGGLGFYFSTTASLNYNDDLNPITGVITAGVLK